MARVAVGRRRRRGRRGGGGEHERGGERHRDERRHGGGQSNGHTHAFDGEHAGHQHDDPEAPIEAGASDGFQGDEAEGEAHLGPRREAPGPAAKAVAAVAADAVVGAAVAIVHASTVKVARERRSRRSLGGG